MSPSAHFQTMKVLQSSTSFLNNLLVLIFLCAGILPGTVDNSILVVDLQQVLQEISVSLRVGSLLLRTGPKI